ncbi:MAG TPA: hypothetical protein VHC47_05360 [Mucilaginibacter sp.]|nr:hypothetical protein [Mucilaginibacter sp.]
MKRKLLITVALVCIFAAGYAMFAGVAGDWKGTVTAPDGNDYPLSYTFKTDSGKLTGTAQSMQGTVDIQNGKMSGDSLSFAIDVNGVSVGHTGKYFADGDSISMNLDYQGMKMHTTLKRAAGQ